MMKSLKKATALLTLAGVVMASGSAFAMPRGHMHRHDRHINRMEQGYNVHSPKSHGPHYGHSRTAPYTRRTDHATATNTYTDGKSSPRRWGLLIFYMETDSLKVYIS